MVTIAKYHRLETAQLEADIIATKGFEVEIEQGHFAGPLGGNQPSFQLKVHEKDLDKLHEIRDVILAEIQDNNPYHCPKCQSKNYEPHEPHNSLIKDFMQLFLTNRTKMLNTNTLNFKCVPCQTEFKVKIIDK